MKYQKTGMHPQKLFQPMYTLKFTFSEKATKIDKILPSIFVAFLENMNFMQKPFRYLFLTNSKSFQHPRIKGVWTHRM